jgi:hypothetical protein
VGRASRPIVGRVVAGAFVLASALATWLFLGRRDEPRPRAADAPAPREVAPAPKSGDSKDHIALPSPPPAVVDAPSGPRRIVFVVRDGAGLPVTSPRATIGDRRFGPLDAQGAFAIEIDTAARELRVAADGCVSTTRELPREPCDLDLGTILLESASPARIVVRDERGAPIARAEIWAADANARPPSRDPKCAFVLAGTTDESGSCDASIAAPSWLVFAKLGERRSRFGFLRAGDSRIELLIPDAPSIVVRVVDDAAKPVAGVRLALSRPCVPFPLVIEGESDPDGRWSAWTPDGPFDLSLRGLEWSRLNGDTASERTPVVPREGTIEQTIVVAPRNVFSIRVVDADTREPIEDFELIAFASDEKRATPKVSLEYRRSGAPHAGGRASYPTAPPYPVDYLLSVKAAGHRQANVRALVSPGDEVVVALERVPELRIRVVSERGEALRGIRVRLRQLPTDGGSPSAPGSLVDEGTTDASGTFPSRGWEDGSTAVEVADERGVFARVATVALPEPAGERTVVFDRSGAVEGRVLGDADADAVDLVLAAPLGGSLSAVSRGAAFRVERVPPGTYRLGSRAAFARRSYLDYWGIDAGTRVEVRSGETTHVDLPSDAAVSLRVTGAIRGIDPARRHWISLVPLPAATRGSHVQAFFPSNEPRALVGAGGAFEVRATTPGEWIACVFTDCGGVASLSLCETVTVMPDRPLDLAWTPGWLERESDSSANVALLQWRGPPQCVWQEIRDLGPRAPLAPGVYRVMSTSGFDGEVRIAAGQGTKLP